MYKKCVSSVKLPVDPVADALADVYLFLLRQAAERQRDLISAQEARREAMTPPISDAQLGMRNVNGRHSEKAVVFGH